MIYSIDPGPVNCGVAYGARTDKQLTCQVMTPEELLPWLKAALHLGDAVVIEQVTPRRQSRPGMWSQTIKIAETIGAVKWIANVSGADLVVQNPQLLRGLPKRKGNPHINDALFHWRYYVRQLKNKPP